LGDLQKTFNQFPTFDPNIQDMLGKTALHYACEFEKVDCVRLLLEKTASPHIADKEGKTPLHMAQKLAHEEILSLLMRTSKKIFDF